MSDVPLHRHWHDLYLKRWLIVTTGVIAAIAAIAFSNLVTPMFEAKTTFFLASNAIPPRYVGSVPDAPPSPLLPTPEEKVASLDVGILRGREIMQLLSDRFDLPLAEVKKRVDVTVNGEFMIDVFVRNPDGALAADMANAAPELYASFHEKSMKDRAGAVAHALEARVNGLLDERTTLEKERLASRKVSQTTADATALARLETVREDAETELDNLRGQVLQADAKATSLDATLRQEAQYYADAETMDTTNSLDGMLGKILELRIELSKVTFTPGSAQQASIEAQIANIEKLMAAERQRLASSAAKPWGSLYEEVRLERAMTRASLAGLKAAEGAAKSRLDAATARFEAALDAVAQSDDITTRIARIDGQITTAEDNLASARLQVENSKVPLVVVEEAVAPTRPIFPLPMLNAIVAALCGLMFGAYYALFLAHSERSAVARRVEVAEMPLFEDAEIRRLRKGETLDTDDQALDVRHA